jgi:hypothetical protein
LEYLRSGDTSAVVTWPEKQKPPVQPTVPLSGQKGALPIFNSQANPLKNGHISAPVEIFYHETAVRQTIQPVAHRTNKIEFNPVIPALKAKECPAKRRLPQDPLQNMNEKGMGIISVRKGRKKKAFRPLSQSLAISISQKLNKSNKATKR